MNKSFNKRLSILAMLSLLTLGNTLPVSALEVDVGGDHQNSIAVISTEQGKENRINVDYRVPRVKVELWQNDTKVSEETSDDWGVTFFDNVPPGDYELRMASSYKGLSLTSDNNIPVSIDKGEQEVFYNTYNGNVRKLSRETDIPKGILEIKLKTDDNKPLSRAEVLLQGVTNKNFSVTLVADSNGVIRAANLEPGDYAVKQSKEAAKDLHYTISEDVYQVSISANKTSDLAIKNKKLQDDFIDVSEVPKATEKKDAEVDEREEDSVVIQVVNPDEVEKAEGINVEVYSPENKTEVLHTLKTDEYGAIRVKDLNKGTYEYSVEGSKERKKFNIEDYESLFTQKEDKTEMSLGTFVSSKGTLVGILVGSITLVCTWLLIKRKQKPSRKEDNKLE